MKVPIMKGNFAGHYWATVEEEEEEAVPEPEDGSCSTQWVTNKWFKDMTFPEGYLDSERVYCHEEQQEWNKWAATEGEWWDVIREELREKIRMKRLAHYKEWIDASHK